MTFQGGDPSRKARRPVTEVINFTRCVIDAIIASQVAGIMEHDFSHVCFIHIHFKLSGFYQVIDQFCMVNDFKFQTILAIIIFQCIVAVRALSNDLFYSFAVNVLIFSFVILSKTNSFPSRRMLSPQHNSSFPRVPQEIPPASSIFEIARDTRLLRASNARSNRHRTGNQSSRSQKLYIDIS